jgi:RimJ/RimL family protein N-acetyltransferase
MSVETERLILRPHAVDDFEALLALWREPEVTRFITGAPATPEDAWARLMRYIGHHAAFGFGFLAATEKANGAYLGDMGVAFFRREMEPSLDGMAEAGWVLNAAGRRRGLAEEGMRGVIATYRARADALPLAFIVAPDNAASLRLAEKLRFARAGEATYRGRPTVLLRHEA